MKRPGNDEHSEEMLRYSLAMQASRHREAVKSSSITLISNQAEAISRIGD